MSRRKNKPSTPEQIAARMAERRANDNFDMVANDDPRVKEGPSARILRQMLRHAHALPAPAPEPRFSWSASQLTRLRRAEAKIESGDKKVEANGVAEIARLTEERAAEITRFERQGREEEILALAQIRGDQIEVVPGGRGGGAKPMIRRSGLEWLRKKNRIDSVQHIAGLRYGDDQRMAEDIRLRSCLADGVGGGDGTAMQDIKRAAYERLQDARRNGLVDHGRMISVCDAVCGDGRTIRQLSGDSEAEAQHNETTLIIALDLLGVHYGIRKCVSDTFI